ncbi:hypothetical protein [Dysgonomonas termitidis]|uniref:AbiV family abortive infection protein n=1 Tax=Dysgonomonas termitidis TaxID=1516126 RepID=A0ABV9L248_9BACT
MTQKDAFCNLLRERSKEHRLAISLMIENGLYGQAISILRQELDSMVRTIFLLEKSDINVRNHYMSQTLNNQKWTFPNSRTLVTDRHMVEFSNNLYGWSLSVYKLGCAFIHLSPMSNYTNKNPFFYLPDTEIQDIKQHLHHYHNFSLEEELNMNTVIPYLQRVFTKVADNLEYNITLLEEEKISEF